MDRQGVNVLRAFACLCLLLLASCRAPQGAPAPEQAPPALPREFRGVWVATVANIDWPSAPGLATEAQQAEARAIIARASTLGMNAILLQVRPATEAMYPSPSEPWSEYLTGVQGRGPEPAYDPLAFWIAETHAAGLELHAWFNPFRARHDSAKSPLAPNHLALTRPELVKPYGKALWLDPAEPGAVEHSLSVILDVVRRYDVDGVHIDDYFYPYPVKDAEGARVEFPDEPSWKAYQDGGGTLSRADWRRSKVNGFVERLYGEVHRAKAWVRVGISPFGMGRPGLLPPGLSGFSQYDELYADPELWLEKGWMDYLAPQLYWKRDATAQAFAPLLTYWRGRNPMQRHVWPGLFTSRLGGTDPWPVEEILGQIEEVRSRPEPRGHVHFSMAAFSRNYGGVVEALPKSNPSPALVPAAPWLGGKAPEAPQVALRAGDPGTGTVRVQPNPGTEPARLAVWARYGTAWKLFVLPGSGGLIPGQQDGHPLSGARAAALDRTGLESPLAPARDERKSP